MCYVAEALQRCKGLFVMVSISQALVIEGRKGFRWEVYSSLSLFLSPFSLRYRCNHSTPLLRSSVYSSWVATVNSIQVKVWSDLFWNMVVDGRN